ncbi:hypothetical protein ACFQ0B_37480 [Nonomuraea thailandensis]
MDVLQWSRHYRCFPGQGNFDLAGLTASVLRAGYTGPLSLEVFNDVFRQASVERTALDGMRSLIALEQSLDGVSHPAVPAGFAFAELADTGTLGGLLSALGFARAGAHASKPVELWSQGRPGSCSTPAARPPTRARPWSRSAWTAPTPVAPSSTPARCCHPSCPASAPRRTRRWTRSPPPTAPRSSSATPPGSPTSPRAHPP